MYDSFINAISFTQNIKYSANNYNVFLEIIMENPGSRFKENLTINHKRI